MFDYGKVETVIGRIVENVDPDMIVVFGSVARREARDDSDLDILVVFDRPYDHKDMIKRISRQFVGLRLGFDLILMSREEYDSRKHDDYSFEHEMMTTGQVVYAR